MEANPNRSFPTPSPLATQCPRAQKTLVPAKPQGHNESVVAWRASGANQSRDAGRAKGERRSITVAGLVERSRFFP